MKKQDTKPLTGVRVLEFCHIAAGSFVGSLLTDLGVDVVKVERRDGGDRLRAWPPLSKGPKGDVFSENFASINRNKRSITADFSGKLSFLLRKIFVGTGQNLQLRSQSHKIV